MNCNCELKQICEIYSFIKNKSDIANITVSNCKYHKNNINTKRSVVSNTNRHIRKEIKRDNEIDNDDFKVVDLNKKETITPTINCPTCNAVTTEDDLKECCKCGKIVCSACGTVDTTNNGKIYCKECWSKI